MVDNNFVFRGMLAGRKKVSIRKKNSFVRIILTRNQTSIIATAYGNTARYIMSILRIGDELMISGHLVSVRKLNKSTRSYSLTYGFIVDELFLTQRATNVRANSNKFNVELQEINPLKYINGS